MEKENVWLPENLKYYLNVYYSNLPDWNVELERLRSKNRGQDQTRASIAFTILAPYELRVKVTDPPQALLFAGFKFDGFKDQDWSSKLESTFARDLEIKAFRQELLKLGSIHPVEYDPRSRQAYFWLKEQALEDPTLTDSDKINLDNRMKSLLLIYGPTAVSAIFQRPELTSQLVTEMPNWRTGYFVERFLHGSFDQDQLLKMKDTDVKRTPEIRVKYFVGSSENKQLS